MTFPVVPGAHENLEVKRYHARRYYLIQLQYKALRRQREAPKAELELEEMFSTHLQPRTIHTRRLVSGYK